MAGIAGVLRGPKKGKSTLGSLVRVFVFTVDQFTVDTDYPLRADITTGELSEDLPLLSSPAQKAARLFFDIGEVKWGSTGKTSVTQFSHKHSLSGKISGYEVEQGATVDELNGQHCLVVGERPNGTRVLLGTLFKPMMVDISADGGNNADGYVGRDIKFEQTDACDFQPPILASSITITSNTIPAYS